MFAVSCFQIVFRKKKYIREKLNNQLSNVKVVENDFTPFLEELVASNNGKLYGLEHRFKSETSAYRKILLHIKDENVKNKRKIDYLNEKVSELKDYLRYTIIFNENDFTSNVIEILKSLKKTYQLLDLKNRFSNEKYKDISTHWKVDSFVVEIQFHTKMTIDAKEITHYLYEIVREYEDKLRKISDIIMNNITAAVIKIYEKIPIPEYVDKIGENDFK